MKTITCIALYCAMAAASFSNAGDASLTDSEIKAILRDRIEVARKSVAMVVGIVDDHGSRVIGYGRFERDKRAGGEWGHRVRDWLNDESFHPPHFFRTWLSAGR